MRVKNVFFAPLLAILLASVVMVSTANDPGIAGETLSHVNLDKNLGTAAPTAAQPWGYSVRVEPSPPKKVSVRDLKDRLDRNDFLAALKALNVALNEVGDGSTFLWRRKNHGLKGAIKPTAAFRTSDGRICRHLVFALYLSGYVKSIESIACRDTDGRWVVDG